MLVVLQAYWVCGLVSDIKTEKIFSYYGLKYFFLFLFLSSTSILTVLGYLDILFFVFSSLSSLVFSVLEVCYYILKLRDSLLSCVHCTDEPRRSILLFQYFLLLAFSYSYSLHFSAYIIHLFLNFYLLLPSKP